MATRLPPPTADARAVLLSWVGRVHGAAEALAALQLEETAAPRRPQLLDLPAEMLALVCAAVANPLDLVCARAVCKPLRRAAERALREKGGHEGGKTIVELTLAALRRASPSTLATVNASTCAALCADGRVHAWGRDVHFDRAVAAEPRVVGLALAGFHRDVLMLDSAGHVRQTELGPALWPGRVLSPAGDSTARCVSVRASGSRAVLLSAAGRACVTADTRRPSWAWVRLPLRARVLGVAAGVDIVLLRDDRGRAHSLGACGPALGRGLPRAPSPPREPRSGPFDAAIAEAGTEVGCGRVCALEGEVVVDVAAGGTWRAYAGMRRFDQPANSRAGVSLFACASGRVYACGASSACGALGLPRAPGAPDVPEPEPLEPLAAAGAGRVARVGVGLGFGLALDDEGAVFAWGLGLAGGAGRLRDEASCAEWRSPRAVRLPPSEARVTGMETSAEARHALLLRADGSLLGLGRESECWQRELGRADSTPAADHVSVIAASDASSSLIAPSTGHYGAVAYRVSEGE